MSLITLPDHLLHQILLHLPSTTSFSLAHPSLHAAVTSASRLVLSHPPPPVPGLHHLSLTSAALSTSSKPSFNNLGNLRSLRLPPLTTQHIPAVKALLTQTSPNSITLYPSSFVTTLIPYLSTQCIIALPHHPAFLSHFLSLIHALPLHSFHLHLPQRLLPYDELVAIATHAKQNNIIYELTIPAYDYPFHTPHTHAPISELTVGYVMMRHEALWSDLRGWEALERISMWGAEDGVLEKLFEVLKGRVRKVRVGEKDDVSLATAVRARGKGRSVGAGFWSHIGQTVRQLDSIACVVDDSVGRGRDFVTLYLWERWS